MLLSYLLYLRLSLTNSRTELMLKEKNQAKDCIRLLEMILHNYQEMLTIPGLENDDDFQSEVDHVSFVYKGVRCRYLAEIFKSTKKWSEALTLYGRTKEYFQRALKGKVRADVVMRNHMGSRPISGKHNLTELESNKVQQIV